MTRMFSIPFYATKSTLCEHATYGRSSSKSVKYLTPLPLDKPHGLTTQTF